MRTFWAIVILLALIAAGLYASEGWREAGRAREAARAAEARASQAEAEAKQSALKVEEALEAQRLGVNAPLGAPKLLPQQSPDREDQPNIAANDEQDQPAPELAPIESKPSTNETTAPPPAAHAPGAHNPGPGAIAPPTPDPLSAEAEAAAVPGKPRNTPKPPPPLIAPTMAPAKIDTYDVQGATMIEQTDDGLVIDGKFTVKGSGTQADPFVVPWDLLVSVQDDFDPGLSALRIPERVAILHGKVVRLEGYVSFPLVSTEPTELLAMLNMWDGCCIGVPPSPYDAVEVHLKGAITGDDRFATAGSVTGTFEIKPFVVKTWLVGLFVMEDAEFKPVDDSAGT